MTTVFKETKIRFRVKYKPTGKTFVGDPPIKAGIQGEFEFRAKDDEDGSVEQTDGVVLNAEDAVKACKRWYNERVVEMAKVNDQNVQIAPERRIYGEHVVVWIEEWHYSYENDGERTRLVNSARVNSDEPEDVTPKSEADVLREQLAEMQAKLAEKEEEECAESSEPSDESATTASGRKNRSTKSTASA